MDLFQVLKPSIESAKDEEKDSSSRCSLRGSELFQRMQPLVMRLTEEEERLCRELLADTNIKVDEEGVRRFFQDPSISDDTLLLFKVIFAFAFGVFE